MVDHSGPMPEAVPHVGPSDGCAAGRVVAVVSSTRRHWSELDTVGQRTPRHGMTGRCDVAVNAGAVVAEQATRIDQLTTALPATYGVADDVPPPMVSVLSVVLVLDAPQLSQASCARSAQMYLGQVSACPLSSPPTTSADGVTCA